MVPATLPRFVRLPGEAARYVAIETVIQRFARMLFPGYAVQGDGAFRVIRDSDIEIEEEAEDLVRYFRQRDQAAAPGPGDPAGARGGHARRRWQRCCKSEIGGIGRDRHRERRACSASPTSSSWSTRTGPT